MLVQLGLLHVCGHNTVAREAQQRLCFYSLRWPLDHVNAAWGTWGKHVRFSKQTVKLKLHDELKLMLVYQIKTVMINKKKYIKYVYTPCPRRCLGSIPSAEGWAIRAGCFEGCPPMPCFYMHIVLCSYLQLGLKPRYLTL